MNAYYKSTYYGIGGEFNVVIEVLAEDEKQAIEMAKKAMKRECYEIIEVKQV